MKNKIDEITIQSIWDANFTPSSECAKLSIQLKGYLGFSTNYNIARLAIGRSLAEQKYPEFKDSKNSSTLSIKGRLLFGEEYQLWTGLIISNFIQHHKDIEPPIGINILIKAVKAHWANGIQLLMNDWENSADCEYDKFVDILIDRYAKLPEEIDSAIISNSSDDTQINLNVNAIKITLGTMLDNENKFEHIVNGRGYSPHIAIMGQAGSGKTYSMLNFVQQIKDQTECSVLLLDLGKGALINDEKLLKATSSKPIDVPKDIIPLDMFYNNTCTDEEATNNALWFREMISDVAISSFGSNQNVNVYEATIDIFKSKKNIDLKMLYEEIKSYYDANNIKTDSVISTMHDLNIHNLFSPKLKPDVFFRKNWIFAFAGAKDTDKKFASCLILNAFNAFLKSEQDAKIVDGFREIKYILAIDEALLYFEHLL